MPTIVKMPTQLGFQGQWSIRGTDGREVLQVDLSAARTRGCIALRMVHGTDDAQVNTRLQLSPELSKALREALAAAEAIAGQRGTVVAEQGRAQ